MKCSEHAFESREKKTHTHSGLALLLDRRPARLPCPCACSCRPNHRLRGCPPRLRTLGMKEGEPEGRRRGERETHQPPSAPQGQVRCFQIALVALQWRRSQKGKRRREKGMRRTREARARRRFRIVRISVVALTAAALTPAPGKRVVVAVVIAAVVGEAAAEVLVHVAAAEVEAQVVLLALLVLLAGRRGLDGLVDVRNGWSGCDRTTRVVVFIVIGGEDDVAGRCRSRSTWKGQPIVSGEEGG